jgi:hypothetical protein
MEEQQLFRLTFHFLAKLLVILRAEYQDWMAQDWHLVIGS